MAKKLILETKSTEVDPWLDSVTEDQRVNLKVFAGKNIEILKGFCYESKKFGRGFTFLFREVGKSEEWYATSFGAAIVRQADDQIVDALAEDSVIVTVRKKTSKAYNSEYLYFDTVDDE